MLGKFQELIIVEEHHRVHCVAFQLEHMLEILLKKKSNQTKKTKQQQQQNPEERDVSLLSSLFEKKSLQVSFFKMI